MDINLMFVMCLLILYCTAGIVEAVIPYPGNGATTDELVAFYFSRSYTLNEIVGFLLFVHNTLISRTTLKRILKRLRLRRQNCESPLIDIVDKILLLRQNGTINAGYRTLWRSLNLQCGVRATQETVRIALGVIDNRGVAARRSRRLSRRLYQSKGPNYCIHIDGYDKLKPYGIAIHGCVDGFSRKILWLVASNTNNNPRHVARNFVNHLKTYKSVPRMVRTDAGTENVMIHRIQMALRMHHGDQMTGENSVTIGRSTANQRIEMLWSFLMPNFTLFWKNLFTSLIDDGKLNNADFLHLECLRFCFLPIIQDQLDQFKEMWNTHRIRTQRHAGQFFGVPDVLFYQPVIYGQLDQSFCLPCEERVLDDILEMYTDQHLPRGSSEEFRQLVSFITGLRTENFDVFKTPEEGKRLFCSLLPLLSELIYQNNM